MASISQVYSEFLISDVNYFGGCFEALFLTVTVANILVMIGLKKHLFLRQFSQYLM